MFNVCGNQSIPSKEKNLVISFSLLMRLFEWCHEDAKDDVAIHKAMEKLVAFNDGVNPLTIDVYDCVIANANEGQECNTDTTSTNEDLNNAYEIGQKFSENEIELNSNGRDYSNVAGTILSTVNDRGVSNDEIASFWNGYEKEPLKQGCWTELDINNDIEKVNQCYHNNEEVNAPKMTFSNEFDRSKPTILNIQHEDCPCAAGDMLDTDTLEQIQQIINAGKL